MSGAHLHLLLTHVPVIGIVFGLLVLTYAWACKNQEATRISLGIFVISSLAAVAVYLTGEAAEHAIEGLAGASEAIIERHEEAAFVALIAMLVLGAVSLVGLWLVRKAVPRWLPGTMLMLALVVASIVAWTANLGGQINHPEIRSTAAVSTLVGADSDIEAHEYDD